MTIYELKDFIIDGAKVQIYDIDEGHEVWEGYPDEIPTEYEGREIGSIEPLNDSGNIYGIICINI